MIGHIPDGGEINKIWVYLLRSVAQLIDLIFKPEPSQGKCNRIFDLPNRRWEKITFGFGLFICCVFY
jgi:intracellular septation protein A